MSNSKQTMKLFLLDKIFNLNEVQETILTQNFKEKLFIARKDIEQENYMTEDEKHFYYTWDQSQTKIEKLLLTDNSDEVIVIETYAVLEYPKRVKKDNAGNILPKKDRINDASIRVIFFEQEKNVYSLIFSSNEAHIDRVRKLIGKNYIKDVDEKYFMPPDLFNWLFYKFSVSKGLLTTNFTLNNISGFIGNSIDEHNIFKSSSDQTSDLIITKAFISNGEILKNITAKITTLEGEIVFSLDHNSNATLFITQSLMYFNSIDRTILAPIYLYKILIPTIKKTYKENSKKFLERDKKHFSAKIGLEVIKSIINNNDIDLKDIQELFVQIDEKIPSITNN
ncbi:hypothetical protein [Enterococcus faecium]|uniref:hypothetical protein n=1 Tax=Enterococcus TaxID=1350 RepID=UPI000A32D4B9|nr:hypothetical protein [Enterococcus faecium]OTN78261.1 hypothetical protein A5826_002113 [Enterococcus faecium]